ncbi:fructose-1-phosphate/6-phosphogluconate phosphatase [secondary endosymbiont of Ctenarytaina eucalypti]|uniref:fructose-1-phosphate/6-phosphogluconate phosphatase n=1 Tax=secondary endosymbiont of Ctenarytaina eucalypti TaxID=1199245 RepID=UPI0005C6FDC6|nr:fructose-1-phosphate/6-phosphogluconate phosphatase [secondary endosymbiont of Ctenarytaina eucalypti]
MYDQYQGLIFDMDGTLVNTAPTHRKAWKQALAPYGMQFDEAAVVLLSGAPTWYIAKMIIESHQIDMDPYQLSREKNTALYNIFFDDITTLPLIEVVKHYHGHRLMAVGTGSEHAVAKALLHYLGLLKYFNAIVGADNVTYHKPDPQTFLRCAELIGVQPETCVVFEDADLGIMAAKAANMAVVDVRKMLVA